MTSKPVVVVIRNVTVIDGTGAAARPAQDVRVEDGRIVASAATGTVPIDGASLIEGAGRTLLPGLIDMHAHLATKVAPGETGDQQLLRASQNARRALAAGVTTLRDAGSTFTLSQTVRDAIDTGLIAGPRIVSCGRMIAPTAYGRGPGRLQVDSAGEMRVAVRRLVEEGVDAIKVTVTGGGSSPGSNVGASHYSAEELDVLVHEARRLGKRVAAHAIGTAGIRLAVNAGVDTIEHCGWMSEAGGLDVDARVIEEMRTRGTTIVPTMGVWYRPGYDDVERLSTDQRKMRAVRTERTAAWRAMFRSGVRFAAGPDTWEPHLPAFALARELELMVGELGLTPLEAVVAATSAAATGLGLDNEIGSVIPGKVADLVLLEGDPLGDLSAFRRIHSVWKSGRLAVREGRVVEPAR